MAVDVLIRNKELSTFILKKLLLGSQKYNLGCLSWILDLDLFPSQIPDPRVRKSPDLDLQHGSWGCCDSFNPHQWKVDTVAQREGQHLE